jgi:hypothetical protein
MRYLAVVCVMLASLSAAVAQMTHEEAIVRTAYAKFAYAEQQGVVGELGGEAMGRPVPENYVGMMSEQRIADAQITFTLSNFVIGDLHSILNRKDSELVTPANTEMLWANAQTNGFEDNGVGTHWNALDAMWRPANTPGISVTIGDLYTIWQKQNPQTTWQNYASYSVVVSFQGKTRGPYKAMFIFGHDDQGKEVIEPKDDITSITGLAFALSKPLFPDSFALTHLREFPVVANWLSANQVSAPTCSVGQGDVCCDLVKMKCGPGHADVSAALAKTLPGNK